MNTKLKQINAEAQIYINTVRQADRLTYRDPERERSRQANRQTDNQTNKQKDILLL